jgi:hypothetical protein
LQAIAAHGTDQSVYEWEDGTMKTDEVRPSIPGASVAGQTHGVNRMFVQDVDEASEDSFPASDPPAWMGLRVGRPARAREARGEQ